MIAGKVKSGCDFFSINIGHDKDFLALHFNPRFKYNKDRNVIVCNSNRGGWGNEQKEHNFPFKRDESFKIVINFNNEQFFIKLPDGNMITFPNRFGDDGFGYLYVDGDVTINSIKMK
ncbi:Galectin-1 [Bagarius yarrelli]|uniref:Galectin n=1 Tax=Bagarius yarrelli TaxID=175774 RepID=A0A556TTQ0_BAGYA|nr:Galectin-1 [Bagarius yarrelli]